MSFCYGPIVLPGLGRITSTTISQQASSLIIENQSLFDVLFSVQVAQPQALTQAQVTAIVNSGGAITTGGWDLHIGPRNFGVLELNAGDLTQSPAGGYWSGTVWILQASLPNVQATAGSIVSDPGPNIWITAYGPGEKLPDPGISSLGYFLASQERQVAVPVVAQFSAGGEVLPGATSTFVNVSTPIVIGNYPFSNPAITSGFAVAGTILFVVYQTFLVMVPLSGVANVAESQQVQVRGAVLDSSSAVVGNTIIFDGYFAHLSRQSVAQTIVAPAYPIASRATVAAGTGPPYSVVIQLAVFNVFGGGGTNIKQMDATITFDIAAAVPTGPGGGFNGTLIGSVYNGFVY